MESALRALLTGSAPLTALVGTRIYWNAYPQGAVDPCVVMYLVNDAPGITMQGPDGLSAAIVQIDVRALTITSMWAVRSAITTLLHGYRGVVGNTDFQGIFLRSERQTSEKPGTVLYHRASLDFDVYSRAAA